jgi:hypothetical protein
VWNLEKLSHWIDQQGFDFTYWNMLHEARHFSISALPQEAKMRAGQSLKSADVRDYHRQEFDRIKDFMMAGESMPVEEILGQIKRLDDRRNQNLAKFIPELAESLGYAST